MITKFCRIWGSIVLQLYRSALPEQSVVEAGEVEVDKCEGSLPTRAVSVDACEGVFVDTRGAIIEACGVACHHERGAVMEAHGAVRHRRAHRILADARMKLVGVCGAVHC